MVKHMTFDFFSHPRTIISNGNFYVFIFSWCFNCNSVGIGLNFRKSPTDIWFVLPFQAIDALEESNIGRSFDEIKVNPNRITIKTSLEDNQVKISISDHGKGMSEEIKIKIFDNLFTTKSVGKGTGLGLAIAQQIIVEKHNGSLFVNSTIGEGAEFVITL